MKTRVNPNLVTAKKLELPSGPEAWSRLAALAIERAERVGSRELAGLRLALVESKHEKHLRMLGIVHPVDIDRLFPIS